MDQIHDDVSVRRSVVPNRGRFPSLGMAVKVSAPGALCSRRRALFRSSRVSGLGVSPSFAQQCSLKTDPI
jgi:hypothetical protein